MRRPATLWPGEGGTLAMEEVGHDKFHQKKSN